NALGRRLGTTLKRVRLPQPAQRYLVTPSPSAPPAGRNGATPDDGPAVASEGALAESAVIRHTVVPPAWATNPPITNMCSLECRHADRRATILRRTEYPAQS